MTARNIIVVGASAGGVEALQGLVGGLRADLPAAVFVVLHLAPHSQSRLAPLLQRMGSMPVKDARDGERYEPGTIYVAVPDRHLLLDGDKILLSRGPFENRTRPAIDALFRSAAIACGPRVIGVVLTGLLDDGSSGLVAIDAAGGVSVVQDPDDARWPSMPRNALEHVPSAAVVPLAEMARVLDSLARAPAGPARVLPDGVLREGQIAARELAAVEADPAPGEPSPLTCPECGGVLNKIKEGGPIRFRCQVGHAFSAASLAKAQDAEIERALVIAARTHRERVRLFHSMEEAATERRRAFAAHRWRSAAGESEKLANALEHAVHSLRTPVDEWE